MRGDAAGDSRRGSGKLPLHSVSKDETWNPLFRQQTCSFEVWHGGQEKKPARNEAYTKVTRANVILRAAYRELRHLHYRGEAFQARHPHFIARSSTLAAFLSPSITTPSPLYHAYANVSEFEGTLSEPFRLSELCTPSNQLIVLM